MAAGKAPKPEAGDSADATSGVGPFVINLCSSTTPMALSSPDSPEMKRFSFFVSRRREDNRERFRLHMGYFSTLAEAEEWLAVVRDIYPGAWAGEAPGKKLRARAAAAAAANNLPSPPTSVPPRVVSVSAQPAPGAAPRASTPAPRASTPAALVAGRAPAVPAAPSTPPGIVVPTLQAAPPVAPPAAPIVSAAPRNSASALMQPVLASVPRPPAQSPTAPPAQSRAAAPVAPTRPAQQTRPAQPARPASAPAAPARASQPAAAQSHQPAAKPAVPKKQPPVPPALSGSNVREVMAALDESTGETRQMRVPPYPQTSAPSSARASTSPASAAPGVSGMRASGSSTPGPRGPVQVTEQPRTKAPIQHRPQVQATDASASMSDTQVLRFLEQRREEGARADDDANSGISLLKPDDTQTRLALKDAVRDNAPVSFAVQLQWSVSPIQLEQVPPLAIFSAYTLYTVEGSREGRKWYGLRLGFFSDAISAKQVAYYVRSEFASVAVVPVSPQEKQRAGAEENKASTGRFAKPQLPQQKVDEFKLFDDDKAVVSEPPPRPVAKAPQAKQVAKTAPPKKNKPLGKVRAKEQKPEKTLEETLEILGASDLEIDNGRGEVLNDTGVRHLRVQVQKNTPFAKLLDRLSERVRRN
jgi:hypothetical protein